MRDPKSPVWGILASIKKKKKEKGFPRLRYLAIFPFYCIWLNHLVKKKIKKLKNKINKKYICTILIIITT